MNVYEFVNRNEFLDAVESELYTCGFDDARNGRDPDEELIPTLAYQDGYAVGKNYTRPRKRWANACVRGEWEVQE